MFNSPPIAQSASAYRAALQDIATGSFDAALQKLQSIYDSKSPQSVAALIAILFVLNKSGAQFTAVPLLEDACQRWPQDSRWPAQLAIIHMYVGDFDQAIYWIDQALERAPEDEHLFLTRTSWLASRSKDPLQTKRLYEAWGQKFMSPLARTDRTSVCADFSGNRKLKVGYVSGDFKNHSVRYFIEPFLKGHDRSQFEIHAFMTMASDEVTDFLKPMVEHWHDVKSMDDDSLYALIRKLGIDILVDLSGHTEGARLRVFAMRAAPVQVTWFGYMQTLGMESMDWRLTDHGICPEGSDAHYTEKLYRLQCMVAYAPSLNAEQLYPSPYIKNGHVTLVSMNHTRKISDQCLATWKEILDENPKAGLLVISSYQDQHTAQESMLPRLKSFGFPLNRVAVSKRLTMREFMSLASIADFALDTFPISGGTTTLHSLWMGLPMIAMHDLKSDGMSSSCAMTLRGLGLSECVALDQQAYKALAGQLIRDPKKIDEWRARCRPALQASGLMDHAARVSEVEQAYRFMWRDFVLGSKNPLSDPGRTI